MVEFRSTITEKEGEIDFERLYRAAILVTAPAPVRDRLRELL